MCACLTCARLFLAMRKCLKTISRIYGCCISGRGITRETVHTSDRYITVVRAPNGNLKFAIRLGKPIKKNGTIRPRDAPKVLVPSNLMRRLICRPIVRDIRWALVKRYKEASQPIMNRTLSHRNEWWRPDKQVNWAICCYKRGYESLVRIPGFPPCR